MSTALIPWASLPDSLPISRRQVIAAGCTLLLPSTFLGVDSSVVADELPTERPQPLPTWDGARQIVYAYQQGPTKGEPCRQLAASEVELPVKLSWQLPPEWVKQFPTLHFLTSSGRWELFEGCADAKKFCDLYEDFNPPARSPRQVSPFKDFVQHFMPSYWSWPGGITNHLLDPDGPHRFSEYELRGLKTSEKKRLHSAHHQGIVEPGRRPPAPEEIASLRTE